MFSFFHKFVVALLLLYLFLLHFKHLALISHTFSHNKQQQRKSEKCSEQNIMTSAFHQRLENDVGLVPVAGMPAHRNAVEWILGRFPEFQFFLGADNAIQLLLIVDPVQGLCCEEKKNKERIAIPSLSKS